MIKLPENLAVMMPKKKILYESYSRFENGSEVRKGNGIARAKELNANLKFTLDVASIDHNSEYRIIHTHAPGVRTISDADWKKLFAEHGKEVKKGSKRFPKWK